MITFDGDRSKNRLWFAKKKITVAEKTGLGSGGDAYAQSSMYEGFRASVWKCGDVSGGRVTAPMGAVILCASDAGIKIAVCDNWAGGCTAYYDLHVLYFEGHISVVWGQTGEYMEAAGYQTIRFRPDVTGAWYLPPVGTAQLIQQHTCTPSVMPYGTAEAFNITAADKLFIDFNNNGVPDFPYTLLDSALTYYSSDGSSLGGKRDVEMASAGATAGISTDGWKTCQSLTGGDQVAFEPLYYDLIDSQFICASHIHEIEEITTDENGNETTTIVPSIDHIYLSDVVPTTAVNPMPSDLRLLMLNSDTSIIRPLGSYAFITTTGELCYLHASYFSPSALPIGVPDNAIRDWFGTHPTMEKWKVFISFTVGTAVTLIDSSQFYSTLQSLAVHAFDEEDPGTINWDMVGAMMSYLLPWPNLSGLMELYFAWKPHDSVMFHGHDDAVYTWTRATGSVKFDATGLHVQSFSVPTEVSGVEGVRPDITYAGNDLYICACNKVKEDITAVYYGNPFTGWTQLPGAASGCTLSFVRPAIVTDEQIILLGVIKEDPIDEPERYRFSSLTYRYVGDEEWTMMSVMPFTIGTVDNFAVGVFGDGPLVKALLDYPSPPTANPQNIVVPYDGYASFRP